MALPLAPVADIKADLLQLPPAYFASKWVFERTPYIFNDDREAFLTWKHDLAERIQCDPKSMLLVGTAALGVSLNPRKNLRAFSDKSDIDVAVVSEYHFGLVWYWLRNLGVERYKLSSSAQHWVDEHRKRLVFWGLIATDQILEYTPLASRWVPALHTSSQKAPANGRDINIRLYRDFDALRAYTVVGLKDLRLALNTPETT